jgi:hypothetical protein
MRWQLGGGHGVFNHAGRDCEGAEDGAPPKMRGEVFDFAAGFTVIDDSYNSNPRSLLNMVRTMVEGGQVESDWL